MLHNPFWGDSQGLTFVLGSKERLWRFREVFDKAARWLPLGNQLFVRPEQQVELSQLWRLQWWACSSIPLETACYCHLSGLVSYPSYWCDAFTKWVFVVSSLRYPWQILDSFRELSAIWSVHFYLAVSEIWQMRIARSLMTDPRSRSRLRSLHHRSLIGLLWRE